MIEKTAIFCYICSGKWLIKVVFLKGSKMKTVDEIIEWRNNKEKSVEEMFEEDTKKLGWDKTDTLYSFLGIYVIGLYIFYPDMFICKNIEIKAGDRRAYSNNYVNENYRQFYELNDLPELKNFISNYKKIGNVIPIWPGGNEHKGKSYCYDIPDIYFARYKEWAKALVQIYRCTYIENIIRTEKKVDDFLKMGKGDYKIFLIDIVKIINDRDEKINKELMQMSLL